MLLQGPSGPISVKDVEDRIRDVVHGKRVRITEYFKDYDRLRTGFITSKRLALATKGSLTCATFHATGHFLLQFLQQEIVCANSLRSLCSCCIESADGFLPTVEQIKLQ